MSRPDQSLRQQLLEARANVQRQIDILATGPVSMGNARYFVDHSDSLAELRGVLSEIEDGLANLGKDDA